MNLKFQKLKLNIEREVFRQLLKVKTFLSVGTFNDSIKDLTDELSRNLPDLIDGSSEASDTEDNKGVKF
jgi:hypothetical protein